MLCSSTHMVGCTHVSVFPHFPYISASRVHPHTHAHKRKQTKTNTHAQTNTHKNAPPHAHTDVSVHMLHIALQMFSIYSHTDLLPCRPQNTSNVHKCWRWGGGTDWNMGTSTHMWWTTHHQLHNVAGKKSRKLHMKKGDLSCNNSKGAVRTSKDLDVSPVWSRIPNCVAWHCITNVSHIFTHCLACSTTTDFGLLRMRYLVLTLYLETKSSVEICRPRLLYKLVNNFVVHYLYLWNSKTIFRTI